MRKFLVVLALVLCMALPATANTWTVTTADALKTAVATSADNGDTIEVADDIVLPPTTLQVGYIYCGLYISPDRTLTLRIDEGCTLSVGNDDGDLYGIYTEGNLTIEGSGDITAHSSGGSAWVYGVYAASGDVTVRNSVKIAADEGFYNYGIYACAYNCNVNVTIQDSVNITASGGVSYVHGIYAYGYGGNAHVTIQDSANITASGSGVADVYGIYAYGYGGNAHVTIQDSANITASGSGSDVYGIYTYVGDAGSADVTVQNGVVSGDLGTSGGSTITLYAGTFSGSIVGGCAFGPDSTPTGSGTSANPYVVTNNASIKFNPASLNVAQGTTKQQTVSVALGVSDNVTLSSFDKLEVTPTSFDGITVEPSSKDGTIKFDVADTCAPNTYTFSVFCQGKDSNNKTHLQTGTFTVTVSEPKPTPSTGSASNGGCNAGFAGLALAAFALLAAKRKK